MLIALRHYAAAAASHVATAYDCFSPPLIVIYLAYADADAAARALL